MIARIYDGFVDLMAYAAVILFFAVMVGIGLDVAARYFLGNPIGWMFEFVQHSMLLILFLGLPWLTRRREHVSVDIVVDAVPPSIRRVMMIAACVISAVVCGHVAAWAAVSTADNLARNVVTDGIYPIPRGWLIGAIALGLALTAIEMLRIAVRMFRDPSQTQKPGDAELDSLKHGPAGEAAEPQR